MRFKTFCMQRFLPLLNIPVFGLTLYINYLAGIGLINNISTGAVSDLYPSLFTPAGFTFAIWGLIYLLNTIFLLSQLFKLFKHREQLDESLNGLFTLVCLTNSVWIFLWHLQYMVLSWLLMLVILALLILAYLKTRKLKAGTSAYFLEHINFSVYLGWICVATIANTAIMLISLGITAEGMVPAIITAGTLIVAMLIGIKLVLQDGNIFLALVLIWACYGILMARSEQVMSGDTTVAAVALVVMSGLLLAMIVRLWLIRKARQSSKVQNHNP